MFYYTFTTFDCNFIPRNAEICKVSSKTKNVGKAHKYRLNRHLPTYEKIIKNLYSFSLKNGYSDLVVMSSELYDKFARMNRIDQAIFESEQEIANGAEIVFAELEKKHFG